MDTIVLEAVADVEEAAAVDTLVLEAAAAVQITVLELAGAVRAVVEETATVDVLEAAAAAIPAAASLLGTGFPVGESSFSV